MFIFLLLIIYQFQLVKLDSKNPLQDDQSILIKLNPENYITSQTNLKIIVELKLGNDSFFNRDDLITVSKDFNKIFSYSPWSKTTNINLRGFKVNKILNGYFVIICYFKNEIDEDTHWEILWLTKTGINLPMTTFFVKANIATEMEISCKEIFSTDCYRLSENDDAIITCIIKSGMPLIKVYLEIPSEANPKVLISNDRRIETRIKLLKSSHLKSLTCGANGVNLTTSRPFEFKLNKEIKQQLDYTFVYFIVIFFTFLTIFSIIIGIYIILIKPTKERSKQKVVHHIEISTEVKRNQMPLLNVLESRKSTMNVRLGSNTDY